MCDHYVSMASESEKKIFKVSLLIEKIEIYVSITSVWLQEVKIIFLNQFLLFKTRDVCDHYVSMASESEDNFFKSVSLI